MSKPRVLFVGRTRYRLPLPPWLAKKWDALEQELDYRVLASAADRAASAGRFQLVPPRGPRPLEGALFYLLLPLRIRRALRRFRPDAVIAEDPHTGAAALVARAGLGDPRPRVIVEVHGNWRFATRLYGSRVRKLLAPLVDTVDRAALRRADAVRALSRYTAGIVEEERGAPATASFPAYIDLSTFTEHPVQPLPERPTALFVGILEPYKNIDGLASAWPAVARALPDARLLIVGKGSRRALVERLRSELPDQVEYVPELAPRDVAARMDQATVVVLPSRDEGLPRVVIESFARGRGLVGSRAGGIVDLVQDGREGLLVDPEDVVGLADALARVLSDRGLAERLGAAAEERYGAWHTTPEEFAARVRALVDAALHEPGAAA
jgi:glycosyltransferase involved in cell wall biosynthesis